MTRPAMKTAMCKKTFFLTTEAFPTDIAPFIRRRNERVVMFHLPIAFFTSDRCAVGYFRIEFFYHFAVSS